MQIILLFLTFFLSVSANAAESTLPQGCQALTVQGESVTIDSKKKSLVYIHNLTENDLYVTHPGSNEGASAGWSSLLGNNHWSALQIAKGPFTIHCIESRPGHEQQIPCENAIAVCEWKKVKFPVQAEGSFWVAENLSLKALHAAAGARGYNIPIK